MWYAYLGREVLHKPTTPDFRVVGGRLTRGLDEVAKLTFSLPLGHPLYARAKACRMSPSVQVRVERDGREVFRGRILDYSDEPTGGACSFTCEDELGELGDAEMPPYDFKGSPRELLSLFVSEANRRHRRWEVGRVTVTDPNGVVVRSNQSRSRLLGEMLEKTSGSSLGGYIVKRREGARRYVDWLSDPSVPGGQDIRLGLNLTDQKVGFDGSAVRTAIFAQGAAPDDGSAPIDLSGMPDGPAGGGVELRGGYMVNTALERRYGLICETRVWDDVTIEGNLYDRARSAAAALSDDESVEVSGADLSDAGYDVAAIEPGQRCRVSGLDLDASMLVEHVENGFDDASRDSFSFGRADRRASGAVFVNDAAAQADRAAYLSDAARAAAQAAGETAGSMCSVSVSASDGYALRSDTSRTILSATVYLPGGESAADLAAFRVLRGDTARIEWSVVEGGRSRPVDPSELSEDGFSVTVSAGGIDGSRSYTATAYW